MRRKSWKLRFTWKKFLRDEGQDLVEYALIIGLIAFGATAGLNGLAAKLSQNFTYVGSTLVTDTA